jgi:hypothetical protein
MRYQRAENPLQLDGLSAAKAFFAGCFAESDPTRECLWVAHVDAKAAASTFPATMETRRAPDFR